ncbi:MAG: hypothetical protein PVJ92_02385, partial [Candidatus Dependentiae bacterium]
MQIATTTDEVSIAFLTIDPAGSCCVTLSPLRITLLRESLYMNNRFAYLLCVVFTLFVSSAHAVSYSWGSATGNDAWDGATTGGLIEEASGFLGFETIVTSYDGLSTHTQYGLFKPAVADDLSLQDTVKIKGDVEIRFEGDGDGTTEETFFIDVGDETDLSKPTKIQAFTDA